MSKVYSTACRYVVAMEMLLIHAHSLESLFALFNFFSTRDGRSNFDQFSREVSINVKEYST